MTLLLFCVPCKASAQALPLFTDARVNTHKKNEFYMVEGSQGCELVAELATTGPLH